MLAGEPLEIALPLGVWGRPAIHPDGRRFAFATTVNRDTAADVWVLRNFLPESQPKK
jgi:tricorn protease-like protein